MNLAAHHPEKQRRGDYVVRPPRATDTIGHMLRGVYGDHGMPDDMMRLLGRLDHVKH